MSGTENLASEKRRVSKTKPNFEDIFAVIGRKGHYQWTLLLLCMCGKLAAVMPTIISVFIANNEASCRENSSATNFSNFSKCGNACSHIMRSTIFSQFSLKCDQQWLVGLSTTVFFVGFVLGTLGSGWLSDTYGRRSVLLSTTAVMLVSSVGAAFVPWMMMFCGFRFLVGVGAGGVFTTSFTLLMEQCPRQSRAIYANIYNTGFSLGAMLLALEAYFVRNHVVLQVISAASTCPIFLAAALVYESPRWLAAQERIAEAKALLKKIAHRNRIPRDNYSGMIESSLLVTNDQHKMSFHTRTRNIFRSPQTVKRLMCASVSWFICNTIYFAIYLGVGELWPGDVFLCLVGVAGVEIPSRALGAFLATRLGRRKNLLVSCVGCTAALLCCLLTVTFVKQKSLELAFILVAKFFVSLMMDALWLFNAELFPTENRNTCISIAATIGRIGALLSPDILLTRKWCPFVPHLFMLILATGSIISAAFLPETRHQDLAETAVDISENLVHRNSQ